MRDLSCFSLALLMVCTSSLDNYWGKLIELRHELTMLLPIDWLYSKLLSMISIELYCLTGYLTLFRISSSPYLPEEFFELI